jgi:hypothetical protein
MYSAQSYEEVAGGCAACGFDMIDVRSGNVIENKPFERVIVVSPDTMSVGRDEGIGAGQSAFKPRFQALLENKETKPAAPFEPVRFPKVKYNIHRPCGAFDCSLSDPDAVRKGTLQGSCAGLGRNRAWGQRSGVIGVILAAGRRGVITLRRVIIIPGGRVGVVIIGAHDAARQGLGVTVDKIRIMITGEDGCDGVRKVEVREFTSRKRGEITY